MDTPLLPGYQENEKSDLAVSIAEAAAIGAKDAVLEEVRRAEQAAVPSMEVETGSPGAHASQALQVAGLIPLKRAETAAAEGAIRAVNVSVSLLSPAARKLIDLPQLQARVATGAASGVKGLAFMAPLAANPIAVLDKNVVAAAAGSGAWAACYQTAGAIPARSTINQWAARLPPILGASLAVAAGAHSRLAAASDVVISFIYGGLFLLVFLLMVGISAVPLMSMSPATVGRHVTFASFTTLILLLTVAFCTLLSGKWFIVSVGVLGGLASLGLFYLWFLSNRYYTD